MNAYGAGSDADQAHRARGGLWVPGSVNLLLGVPAILPLSLAWWLLTKYVPMDCKSVSEAAKPGLTNCNYTILDHSGPVMFLLALTGALMFVLVLVVDVLMPRQHGKPLGIWLAAAVLIPVPFVICMSLV